MERPQLLFIVGPTASGKTERAIREAEQRGAVILSCDSLCVYRGMDIGTAKPTPEEQARVPHYGIDLVDASEPFSVDAYHHYCSQKLEQWQASGQPVIVTGGSGFYLASFFRAVTDTVPVRQEDRDRVAQIEEVEGLAGLQAAFIAHNEGATAYPGLDLQNGRRVKQALLRCLASGQTYAHLHAAFLAQPPPYTAWEKVVWLIERSPEELSTRNRNRVQAMLAAGLVDEVKRLREHGFEANPSAAGAIGYREVIQVLDGKLPSSELEEQIFIHTRQLMRKQRNWLHHQLPVDRIIDPGSP